MHLQPRDTIDTPSPALRLFLAAQIASEYGSGFEDLAYDMYDQAFSVYEDLISESRVQLAAITLIIGTLQDAKVLKKPHQKTAVHHASHLWWQEDAVEVEGDGEDGEGVSLCVIDRD